MAQKRYADSNKNILPDNTGASLIVVNRNGGLGKVWFDISNEPDADAKLVEYQAEDDAGLVEIQLGELYVKYDEASYGVMAANGFNPQTMQAIKTNFDDGLLNSNQVQRYEDIKGWFRTLWGVPGQAGSYYTRKDEIRNGTLDVNDVDVKSDHPWIFGTTEDFWRLA